jgi:hypothetical protein
MQQEPHQVIHCYTLSGESVTVCMYLQPGKMEMRTADGKAVDWLDHGHYRVVETTLELFCDDANAP